MAGTSYMRLVMENLDNHPVLTSAAYNAGPGRAKRWRADRPLEGAIYAETIPFNETRDYVKKVMSNSVDLLDAIHGTPRFAEGEAGRRRCAYRRRAQGFGFALKFIFIRRREDWRWPHQ